MGRKHQIILIIAIAMLTLLTACSDKQTDTKQDDQKETSAMKKAEDNKDSKDENSIEDMLASLPKPTQTTVELANADAGMFSGQDYDELTPEQQKELFKQLEELPKLGEEPSGEEIELYWRKLLYLFHEDYPNPAEVLDELEMESFGSPDIKDERYQFKENLNVEILLDASGSMANQIDGKTMMDIAKESIGEFAEDLPEGANVALRVYGHKGTGSDQDKELSCKSNELIYEMGDYNGEKLNSTLQTVKPAGWTPLAAAIEEAKNDLLSYKGDKNTNIIYLVSDGVETCDGNPVEQAKSLGDSDIQPIVNVIGFDLDAEGQNQLKEVAKSAKGIYSNARNQSELKEELDKAKQIAEKWDQWKNSAIEDASSQRYDLKLQNIPTFGIEWNQANRHENLNILKTLTALRNEEQITKEASSLLSDLADERFSFVSDLNDEIRLELRSLADSNFESVKQEIEKKYNENQSN
jgi:Ca-activated chloride channel homolog